MNKKIVKIHDIGAVTFQKSKRAKLVRILIKTSKQVKVVVPMYISYEKAKNLFNAKIEWVKKTLKKIEENTKEYTPVILSKQDIEYGTILLTNRLQYLAKKYNFHYNKVTFRRQKTIWGSCSAKNNISLNIKIVKLPKHLQDYVILHELVHTKFKNHQKEYWNEFSKVLSDPRKYDKELNKYYLNFI